jgi:magnesium-transporting ATPase (P-type)
VNLRGNNKATSGSKRSQLGQRLSDVLVLLVRTEVPNQRFESFRFRNSQSPPRRLRRLACESSDSRPRRCPVAFFLRPTLLMGKKPVDEAPVEPAYPFFAKTKEECLAELGCSADLEKVGLTSDDAALRLEKYGANKLTEKEKKTMWQRIWNQISNVLVAILVFVAIVSLARAVTSTTVDDIVSNVLQIALIVFVIV